MNGAASAGRCFVQAEAGAAGREMQRRYYCPAAYAATKLVLDGLLLRALPALLFALPFYFLMGLNPAALQVGGVAGACGFIWHRHPGLVFKAGCSSVRCAVCRVAQSAAVSFNDLTGGV